MINLNKGLFIPTTLVVTIILIPVSLACLILCFVDFTIGRLVISIALMTVYIFTIVILYMYSKQENYYLINSGVKLIIKYPNVTHNLSELEIEIGDIIKIEYYKLSSFKSWCLLFFSIAPRSVFITFRNKGKEEKKLIGYPKFAEISELCKQKNICLIIR